MSHTGNITGNYSGNFAGHDSSNYSKNNLWSPIQLRATLWLDAADVSTISVDAGGVNFWGDKSGNGRHATTTVRKPAFSPNTIKGLSVITFTAAQSTKLDTSNFSIAPSREFCSFAVVSAASLLGSSSYRRIWVSKGLGDSSSVGSTYQEGFFGSGPNPGEFLQIAGSTGILSPIITGLGTSNPVLLTGAFGTAGAGSNENTTSANGGARASLAGQSGTLGTTGIRIGSDVGTTGAASWNSWIAEIILTTAISFSDLLKIEGYLAWKWGIQNNLPATHPYRNRAPLIRD